MKISIKEKTKSLKKESSFEKILITLEGFDCSKHVMGIKNLTQNEQRASIKELQNTILDLLKDKHKNYKWVTEYKVSDSSRDSIDIFGYGSTKIFILELDTARADQISKKLISRTALLIDKKICYISLCYSGTKKMSKTEYLKYFRYCNIIQTKLGNYFAGLMIE